jgi:hypothetical protein
MQQKDTPTLPELRKAVSTAVAAKALNRHPQTLRNWACTKKGPLQPIRIHGRLAWPVDELARLLGGTEVPNE